MEGIRGGRIVGVGDQDVSDEMQCPEHPYRGNHGGGVCPLCLRDRLRNLVSSSLPPSLRRSYASSSSASSSAAASPPGFKTSAAHGGGGNVRVSGLNHETASSSSLSLSLHANSNGGNCSEDQLLHQGRARAPIPVVEKQKKSLAYQSSSSSSEIVFKRSKSAVAPSRSAGNRYPEDKRSSFWSFLYPPSTWKRHRHGSKPKDSSFPSSSPGNGTVSKPKERAFASSSMTKKVPLVILEDDDDDDDPMNLQTENGISNASVSSPESKVSRSRSVGCGSRSFSGDFFERISTGFGDCALRRVESQREAKPRISASSNSSAMKDDNKVRCGLIFSSFPSSHPSPHWVSSSSSSSSTGRGRSRSWVWAFASPMRASNKPPTHRGTNRRQVTETNNSTPDLSSIPSLLALRT